MRTPAAYRTEAAEYIERAQGDVTPARRTRLLQMAESCLRLADQAEFLNGTPPEADRPAARQPSGGL